MGEVRKTRLGGVQGVIYDFTRIKSVRAQAADAASDSDEAGITAGARELSRALTIVRSASDVRPDRVSALRSQVASGAYEPDPRQIARAILGRGF